MVRNLFKKNESGFSLVELLVVVAIIGVLASAGIPAFRRMLSKSKQGEAKTELASIADAEAAFFAEYGWYGNNLSRMGFAVDGNAVSLTYVVGFPAANCADTLAAYRPGTATAPGSAITISNPNYYTAQPAGTTNSVFGKVGVAAVAFTACQNIPATENAQVADPVVTFRTFQTT